MLSSGMRCYYLELMLSSGTRCYYLELMLSSGTRCYLSGANVIIWNEMLLSRANVIIWDEMLLSGANVTIWDEMLLSGANVIIWDEMLSYGAIVIIWEEMLSSEANVIIWFYHVMLSSVMITPPFLFFPKTSLTPQRTLFLLLTNNNYFPGASDEKLVALFEFRRLFYIAAERAGVVRHSVDFVVWCIANVFEGWRIFKIIAMTPK